MRGEVEVEVGVEVRKNACTQFTTPFLWYSLRSYYLNGMMFHNKYWKYFVNGDMPLKDTHVAAMASATESKSTNKAIAANRTRIIGRRESVFKFTRRQMRVGYPVRDLLCFCFRGDEMMVNSIKRIFQLIFLCHCVLLGIRFLDWWSTEMVHTNFIGIQVGLWMLFFNTSYTHDTRWNICHFYKILFSFFVFILLQKW